MTGSKSCQGVMRKMSEKYSEISRLKIKVDNQRSQLKRANASYQVIQG
jgi:hypothetical protein